MSPQSPDASNSNGARTLVEWIQPASMHLMAGDRIERDPAIQLVRDRNRGTAPIWLSGGCLQGTARVRCAMQCGKRLR
jgi:hypothetical protein